MQSRYFHIEKQEESDNMNEKKNWKNQNTFILIFPNYVKSENCKYFCLLSAIVMYQHLLINSNYLLSS